MTKNKTLVIGSGISGLSAAVFLAKKGRKVEVWEAKKQNGGLLAPISFQNTSFDRGSHRVHPESHPLLQELTSSEDWVQKKRRGCLVLGGRSIEYPPKMIPFLMGLGVKSSLSMAWGFATRPTRRRSFQNWEKDRSSLPDEDIGFERFVVSRVGRSAYEKFYRPYAEKVWGVSPDKLSRTVAKQRISTSNPIQTFRRALSKTKNTDRYFLYPQNGLCSLMNNLRETAARLGVQFVNEKVFDGTTSHTSFEAIFFSGHLTDLVPTSGLNHRGLYVLHMAFPKGSMNSHDTWYLPEKEYWFGRVSQPSSFSSELQVLNQDVCCVEIPEGRWGKGVNFLNKTDEISKQLFKAGILSEAVLPTAQKQTWIPKVYPMYVKGWFTNWLSTLNDISTRGSVYPIGRQGLFLHCNMDHCVHISSEAVEHVISGGTASEWVKRCTQFLDIRVRD